jgi:hypothetical protein
MKYLKLLCLLTLLGACSSQPSESEGRQELKRLYEHALISSSEVAVVDGEKALALMDSVKKSEPQQAKHSVLPHGLSLFPLLVEKAHAQNSNDIVDRAEKSMSRMNALRSKIEAEDIAVSGEEDFLFEAFDESVKIFELALKKNPNNLRAKLYVYYLRPFKYLKGLKWRAKKIKEDESFNYDYLKTLDPANISLDRDYNLFLMTPYKKPFKFVKEIVEEILKPGISQLIKSSEVYGELAKQRNLNITLHLPKALFGYLPVRVRAADLKLAESYALGTAIYLKHITSYDTAKARADISYQTKNTQRDWDNLAQDPQFGLLMDREFFETFQERHTAFSNALQLAIQMLQSRLVRGQNNENDAFQFTPA